MNSSNVSKVSNICLEFIFVISGILILSSCAKKVHFATSAVVPAAVGSVKVTKDRNNNYAINIEVSNLASPDRLTPAKKVYVVWIITKENDTKNIGQLVSKRSFFSKTLRASLKTLTPFNPEKIFVTAENDGNVQQPGNPIVLDIGEKKLKK